MNNKAANSSSFEHLIKPGTLGFFNAFECVAIFILDKVSDNKPINIFTIFIAVERNNINYNQEYLTSKLIPITEEISMGIIRRFVETENAHQTYIKLCKYTNQKNSDLLDIGLGDEVHLGSMEICPESFVPHDHSIPINSVLKNNTNGSYIIEFFDCDKKFPLDEKNIYDLCEKIYKVIPINLQSLRDRLGNIVFQFPSQIIFPSIRSKLNGQFDPKKLYIDYQIDQRAHDKKYQGIVYNYSDGIVTGFCSKEFTEEQNEIELIGVYNFDKTQLTIQDLNSGLIMYVFSSNGVIEGFSFNMAVNLGMRRKIKNDLIEIKQVDTTLSSPIPQVHKHHTMINKRKYDRRLEDLEKTLSFSQYSDSREKADENLRALKDIRTLINRDSRVERICLWDPYLSADDILNTLFYSEYYNVQMMAISSAHSAKLEKELTQSELDYEKWKTEQFEKLNSSDSLGINLEFRCQHGVFGYKFHDRFLIVCYRDKRCQVWSLGKSLNAIGKEHHIFQLVEHSEYILDAFDRLWTQLSDESCVVWKKGV